MAGSARPQEKHIGHHSYMSLVANDGDLMGIWAPPKPCLQLVPWEEREKHIVGLPQQLTHPPATPLPAAVSLH